MKYYTNNNSPKLWKDNKVYNESESRRKRTFIQSPKPGRPFESSLPLERVLILHFKENQAKLSELVNKPVEGIKDVLVMVKFLINNKQVKVNNKITTESRAPVSFKDWLEMDEIVYTLEFVKNGAIVKAELKIADQVLCPIKKWAYCTSKKRYLNIQLFQNKIISLEIVSKNEQDHVSINNELMPLSQLIEKLRKNFPFVTLDKDEAIDAISCIAESPQLFLVKLSGKDSYQKYQLLSVNAFAFNDGEGISKRKHIKLHLKKEDLKKEVVLMKKDLNKKFVVSF